MTVCTSRLRVLACAIPLMLAAGVRAQSFNIDLDIMAGPPEAGNGAPSSAFGGASGSVGFWNRVDAAGPRQPVLLAGLDGGLTSASIQVPGGGGGAGGSGWNGNSGDHAFLLNDYAVVPDELVFRFAGMRPGPYRLYTYASVPIPGYVLEAEVWVPGSRTLDPQIVSGPMPGNGFAQGLTHSVHELDLFTNEFEIIVRNRVQGPPNAYVNGMQIVAVPEPVTVVCLIVGTVAMVRRRTSM